MHRTLVGAVLVFVAAGNTLLAQTPAKPMSPEGSAHVQVLGKWIKPERPAFTLGRENYEGGKWIEITYGRPLQRGRDLFGSGASYGKAVNDVGTATFPAPPVWRAGADISTYLMSDLPLVINGKTVPSGGHTLFIDLKENNWTFIVSGWQPQQQYNPGDKTKLWGSFGYTRAKDVVRAPMKLTMLPYSTEELTWEFIDMSDRGGTIALRWDHVMATVTFTVPTVAGDKP